MHTTALQNAQRFHETYVHGRNVKVVEIGSQDVNGSIRNIFKEAESYIGVDFVKAPGVDLILDDPYKIPLSDCCADIVVCSSVLEHSEFFWLLFLEGMRILKNHGLFFINVPSNGSYHRYPVDCWRFYPDSGLALERWAIRNNFSALLLESYISNQVKETWNDFIGIFVKDVSCASIYKKRIVDSFKDYSNGYSNLDVGVKNLSYKTEDQLKAKLRNSHEGRNKKTCKIRRNDDISFFFESGSDFVGISGREKSFFAIRGWAIPDDPSVVLNLAVQEGSILKIYPFNEARGNALLNIKGNEGFITHSQLCGFNYSFESFERFRIGFEYDSNITWVLGSSDTVDDCLKM